MTLKITDAELEIYEPGDDDPEADTPTTTVPAEDIVSVSQSKRTDEFKDSGEVIVWNGSGEYAGRLQSGDLIRFLVSIEGESGLSHRFSGMTRGITYTRTNDASGTITAAFGGFVGEVMSARRATIAREDRPIASDTSAEGTEDEGLINELLRRNCPELKRDGLRNLSGQTSDIYLRNDRIKRVADGLAARADALMFGRDTTAFVREVKDLETDFVLGETDITGVYDRSINDDALANSVRVDGGDNFAVENENLNPDTFEAIDATSRIVFGYNTRKSETDRIRLYTRRNTNASPGDNLRLRLQAANSAGDAPIAPDDESSDVVQKQLTSEFLAEDGFTEFIFSDHTLPARDMYVIVEGTGNHEVGIASNGDPVYKQFYPFPLLAVQENFESIDEYRRREYAERDQSLRSRTSVKDRVNEVLHDRSRPNDRLNVEAESKRAHELRPGDAVFFERLRDDISGTYAVLDRDDAYDGTNLTTTLTLQEVTTL